MRVIEKVGGEKGFVLVSVLLFLLVVFLLGATGMYISKSGYLSQLSQYRFSLAEKASNMGIAVAYELASNGTCKDGSGSLGSVVYNYQCRQYGSTYFLYSKGIIGNSKVVKVVAMFYSPGSSFVGAGVFRNLNNLSLGGSGSIEACDPSCIASALVTGNKLNQPIDSSTVCKNNNKGVVAGGIDPYRYDPNLYSTDLTPYYFQAKDRNDLLNKLSSMFNVKFSDGTPIGVNQLDNPKCDLSQYNLSCTATGQKITCSGGSSVNATWSGSYYTVNLPNNVVVTCGAIELGQNGYVNFNGFSGGGVISANNVDIAGSITASPQFTIIVKNQLQDVSNGYTLQNVNIFAKNITIDDQNGLIYGGILYSGGKGTGNFNINLNSNSQIGSGDNPVLIISDNNINISRNGNADIYGLVFVNDANNNLSIGYGNGNFGIHGSVVSNSKNNNNINISGNFKIQLSSDVLKNLANKWGSLMKPFSCGGSSGGVLVPFVTTKMQVY